MDPIHNHENWIIQNRCGGKVTWDNGGTINDYNKLPAGGYRKLKISAIDGSDSCIMEHGFLHFKGLDSFTKMSLVNNKYLTDDSMGELVRYARNKLRNRDGNRIFLDFFSIYKRGIIEIWPYKGVCKGA